MENLERKSLFFYLMRNNLLPGRQTALKRGMLGDVDVHEMTSCKDDREMACIIDTVREHVKKYGTLGEIRLGGHGDSESIGSSLVGHSDDLDLQGFLFRLQQLQTELGIKIADRVVFSGCEVFTNLTPEDVNFYRDAAKILGSEIAGPTSTGAVAYGVMHAARYVRFTPNGKVERDPIMDTPYNPVTYIAIAAGWALEATGLTQDHDASWLDCHKGHTQTEGAACQREKIKPHIMEMLKEAQQDLRERGQREPISFVVPGYDMQYEVTANSIRNLPPPRKDRNSPR
jgi:hypothetical protein